MNAMNKKSLQKRSKVEADKALLVDFIQLCVTVWTYAGYITYHIVYHDVWQRWRAIRPTMLYY